VAHAMVTIVVAVALIFIAIRVLPGNPLLTRFGQHPDAKRISEMRTEFGLDQPVVVQFVRFTWRMISTGDLGKSLTRPNVSVSGELAKRAPATIELTAAALLLAIPLGIGAGAAAAVF